MSVKTEDKSSHNFTAYHVSVTVSPQWWSCTAEVSTQAMVVNLKIKTLITPPLSEILYN